MRWVTCERPTIVRQARPGLGSGLVDPAAESPLVQSTGALATAGDPGASRFDVAGVELAHDGLPCRVDAALARHRRTDPTLDRNAGIVQVADADTLVHSREAAGRRASSRGPGANIADGHALARQDVVLDDATCTGRGSPVVERHGANPSKPRQEMQS